MSAWKETDALKRRLVAKEAVRAETPKRRTSFGDSLNETCPHCGARWLDHATPLADGCPGQLHRVNGDLVPVTR